jgi:hypothetical protein
MANDFYNHGSFPTTGSAATSASMRAELDSIAAGFDKMPTLTGNANEIVVVNSSGTALTAIPTLPATSGGTGFASYAVGDLLFASTTTALSKLADVATGNALISGGVGVAPSYGKIGLTTHVSGTLPVANGGTGITSFGTGVATALGVNVGTAGAFVVNGGALGTPSSGTVTNLTGTASININGTVGATTANTGAFTTLSATGVTTVQAGTVSAPAITTSGDTNTGIFFPAADTIAFTEGGVESMRIDSSGNLGIGTTTPEFKLTAVGALSSFNTRSLIFKNTYSGPFSAGFFANLGSVTSRPGFECRGGVAGEYNGAGWEINGGDTLIFYSGTSSERMRLDSSGNLGLGVTPSASWWASMKSIGTGRVGNGIFGATGDDEINIGANVISTGSGTYIYGATDTASLYRQVAAQHVWLRAASGTAGAAMTLTESMRIDSSGNVGIGQSNPSDLLHIYAASSPEIRIQDVNGSFYVGRDSSSNALLNMAQAYAMIFQTSNLERMRIDSAGNVGIGTSSPSVKLAVTNSTGTYSATTANTNLSIYSNSASAATGNFSGIAFSANAGDSAVAFASIGISSPATGYAPNIVFQSRTGVSTWAERMRIDSAGNLGLGVTPSTGQFSSIRGMEIGRAGSGISGRVDTNSDVLVSTNAVRTAVSSYTYGTTDFASLYRQVNGTHLWATAASGTAGNAITFTQAMTLDAGGRLLIGTTTVRTGYSYPIFIEGTTVSGGIGIINNAASTTGSVIRLSKTRGTTAGSVTAVVANDTLGAITFDGADGTNIIQGATISAAVDGTPGTNDMPGRLVFATTADGASTPTERMRIDSAGNLGLGVTPSAWAAGNFIALQVGKGASIVGRGGAGTEDQIYVSANAYNDGAWKYIGTGNATNYYQDNGEHVWRTAPSGTAGNPITFTQVLSVSGGNSLALEGATSQAGTGITFPATQSASTDANTLDDYEEGTWTGFISDGTNNATMDRNTGWYVKIGRQVTVTGWFRSTSLGSVTGAIRLTGLPFAINVANGAACAGTVANGLGFAITAGQNVVLSGTGGNTFVSLQLWDAATGTTAMDAAEWSADGAAFISMTYQT